MKRTVIALATAALALGLAPATQAQSSVDHRQEGPVRVHYWTGDPACYGAHAVLVETPWAVHVRVITGPRLGGADVCTMIALEKSQVLQLSAPLGDRSLHV